MPATLFFRVSIFGTCDLMTLKYRHAYTKVILVKFKTIAVIRYRLMTFVLLTSCVTL